MTSFGITDIGQRREMNQDYIFYSDTQIGRLPNLYIVADGMGGHNAGDYASRCAADTMKEYVEQSDYENPVTVLKYAILKANERLIVDAQEQPELSGMGTTVVACVICDRHLYVANMGDSRLYRITKDHIEQITMDHSLVEELIRSGKLERENVRNHPEKNIITKAVGATMDAMPDFFELDIEDEDRILLCSDGLSNMVEDDEIEDIIREENSLEIAVHRLIDRANYYGGRDNISVVLIGK